MRKKTESLLYSAGGLVAALIILVLLNLVLGAVRGRIDLTQGKLYTLSEGTRAILGKLESPVKIRLYFSQSEVPLPIKAYGRRVEDLLAEFRHAAQSHDRRPADGAAGIHRRAPARLHREARRA